MLAGSEARWSSTKLRGWARWLTRLAEIGLVLFLLLMLTAQLAGMALALAGLEALAAHGILAADMVLRHAPPFTTVSLPAIAQYTLALALTAGLLAAVTATAARMLSRREMRRRRSEWQAAS